jgi:hypothetical protein
MCDTKATDIVVYGSIPGGKVHNIHIIHPGWMYLVYLVYDRGKGERPLGAIRARPAPYLRVSDGIGGLSPADAEPLLRKEKRV